MAKVKTTIYLHADKSSMREKGEELGLEGEALENFKYCGYEVELELEVDTETGEYTILSANG